jgi:hypothetical protein
MRSAVQNQRETARDDRYKWVALAARGVLSSLPAAAQQTITGREFFPDLISGPFQDGLVVVFALATALTALAALASALRGGRSAPQPDSGPQPQTSAKPV